ncbi:SprT-like domain-containing protein [uncultured Polaribacter sp.]|uniref:SprT-like domain-containing protein n=1 Tax=uncultured Polaribacter sp. TaxID=174711 RepID=UPI00262C4B4D|nr:SprT-like domain-containing protein [uncultured Polaribacter sp.]
MKKNKLISFLKIGILFFGISLLLWNCEKENSLNQFTNNNSTNLKITSTTLEQVNSNKDLETTMNSFKSVLDISKAYSKSSKNENSSTITILTDSIVKIESGFSTSYTFNILTPTSASSDFENFVIEKKNDTVQLYIWRYTYVGNSEDYPFTISRLNVDSKVLNNANIEYKSNNYYSKYQSIFYDHASGCWFYQDDSSGAIGLLSCGETSGGDGGGTSGASNSGGGFTGNNGGYFGGSTDNDPSPTGGGGGSQSNSNSNSNTSYSIPLFVPYEKQIADCLGPQNYNYTLWLDNSNTDYRDIKNVSTLLNNNDCSSESQEFALKAIKALEEGAEVDFDEQIINKLTGKADCVYNKLLSSGSSNFHNMITDLFIEFGDNNIGGRNLTFKMSSDLPNDVGGKTQVDSNGDYRILINENLMSTLSSIEVAAILVHEMAHAFLGKHYNDSNSSFTELYEKYINDTGIQNYSHDIMRDQFINRMATAIRNYDNSIFSSFEDYKVLASQGVFELTNDQKDNLFAVKLISRNNDTNCN